ncbi:ABC transporter substrate-binding protein [Microbacterium sp. NPDC058342]|uniref:ABC transporter substrate-binding protein n=1 Tax=Microbacterium sp. NPDC058342 TaxID=3346454 RepID=UPI00365D7C1C
MIHQARTPRATRTRRTFAGIAAALTTIALASCAVGTGGATKSDAHYDPGAELTGTLSVMGFSGVDEVATTRADMAREALGDVEVKLAEGELDMQQLLSAIAAGDPPDLIYADRDQIGSLAARGAIIPLEPCIDGEGIPTGDFDESALAQVSLNDEIYGIPEFNSVQIIMANQQLLDAAGLTVADVNGSDWEKVSAASEKLMKENGGKLDVIGFDSKLPEFLPLWARANGADLISADGRTAQLDDPKVIEALTWAASIYDDQGGFDKVKAYRDSADFFGKGNQFATNVLGAMPMEQWYVNVLNDVSPDAPLVFDTVRDREGEALAYASGSAWAIPAGSDDPEAACRWARVMTSVDAWKAAAEARVELRDADGKPFTGILTGNRKADAEVETMLTDGGEPWDTAVKKVYEANEHTFALPANPADAEFTDAVQDAVNAVLNGQKDPAQALGEAQDKAQKALDEGWSKLEKNG